MNTKLISKVPFILLAFILISSCGQHGNNTDHSIPKDGDGNTYNTITIGGQVWMSENLRTTSYRDGSPIQAVTDNLQWAGMPTAAYCSYQNNSTYGYNYGYLYNWYAVHDSRNIAPEGWHVATDADWMTLVNYLGGFYAAGGKLKEIGTIHWTAPNTGADNTNGFSAVGGGYRHCGQVNPGPDQGDFFNLKDEGNWWSSTEVTTDEAWMYSISYSWDGVSRTYFDYGSNPSIGKTAGLSVRCVKD